jgi:quercetin dioxygenase-like cupin family protein
MIALDPKSVARAAVGASATRPATALLFDSPDLRLIVFRLKPGMAVPVHTSESSVMLTVLEGEGIVRSDVEERVCRPGDVVCFAPREPHGMSATETEFHLLATITPRPGERHAPIGAQSAQTGVA